MRLCETMIRKTWLEKWGKVCFCSCCPTLSSPYWVTVFWRRWASLRGSINFLALSRSWGRIWGTFIVSYGNISFLWSTEPVLPTDKPFQISLLFSTINFPSESGKNSSRICNCEYAHTWRYIKALPEHGIGKLVQREWEDGKRGFSAFWELPVLWGSIGTMLFSTRCNS